MTEALMEVRYLLDRWVGPGSLAIAPSRSGPLGGWDMHEIQPTTRDATRELRMMLFLKPRSVQCPIEDDQIKFRFSQLPLELQLTILEYVLIPGDIFLEVYTHRWGYGRRTVEKLYRTVAKAVDTAGPLPQWVQRFEGMHLKYPKRRFHRVGGSPSQQQPGYGLMAMSKFLYEKGHPMFYGQNTFHLAPGPLAISSEYFDTLLPRHRNLIRSIAVTFTIADLTPEAFQEVEADIRETARILPVRYGNRSRQTQVGLWTGSSVTVLESTWREKINWLLTWQSLEQVILSGPTWDLIVKGEDIPELLGKMDEKVNGERSTMWEFLRRCRQTAREELMSGFERRGTWMEARGPMSEGTISGRNNIEALHLLGRAQVWKMDIDKVKDWLNGLGPGVRFKREPRYKVKLRASRKKKTASA